MKILFLTNIPSPYRVDFFNQLGLKCELTVLFEKRSSTERDESWKEYQFRNFTGIFLQGKSIKPDMAICPGVIKYIKDRAYEYIICSNFSTPTGMIAIAYMKTRHISYWLESDGGKAKTGKCLKEIIKRKIISGANGYFSTGKENDEYYMTYGARKNLIHRYHFSSIRREDILLKPVTDEEKKLIKKQLGIKEKKLVLAVGQFIKRKGFDVLIKSAKIISKQTAICFVGGQPTEEYIRLTEEYHLSNVYFIGYLKKDDLKEYFKAADIFVLPTREDIWGLVINEAMAYGLPVISTDQCVSAGELIHGNGMIVPVEDSKELANSVNSILSDKLKYEKFSFKSIEIAKEYTIETMVADHINLFERMKRDEEITNFNSDSYNE